MTQDRLGMMAHWVVGSLGKCLIQGEQMQAVHVGEI